MTPYWRNTPRGNGGLRKNHLKREMEKYLPVREYVNGMSHPCPSLPSSSTSEKADNRHWSIDLIQLHSLISRPIPTPSSSSSSSSTSTTINPLRLRLHLSNPPNDKLNLSNDIEQCRSSWLNQVKEADFVRWRNTSRSTGLRRGEFDAGWEGIYNGESQFEYE